MRDTELEQLRDELTLTEWCRNEDGYLYIDPDTGEPAWRAATYPLSSYPPEWPKETT